MPSVTPYDLVPFTSGSLAATRPDHLALTSWLHGGPRPPTRGFRCLELGCGDGANLIPLAFANPESSFIGLDSSTRQLDAARAAARSLGLSNLSLLEADLRRPPELEAKADYVIAPGLLSWVAEPVRRRLLELCAHQLSPGGLALMSYNCRPGWSVRGLVRRAVRRADDAADEPSARIRRARALAERLIALLPPQSEHPYQRLLAAELRRLTEGQPWYVFHEYLGEHNQPFTQPEVAHMAARAGLVFLADAQFDRPEGRTPEHLCEAPGQEELGDSDPSFIIDLLGYRQHRVDLFCRAEAPRRPPPTERELEALWVAARIEPTGPSTYRSDDGEEIELDAPWIEAAWDALIAAKPWEVSVSELLDLVEPQLAPAGGDPEDRAELCEHLLEMHRLGYLELRLRQLAPPAQAGGGGLSPLTELELELDRPWLTTPWHSPFGLDEATKIALEPLVGARGDRSELRDRVLAALEAPPNVPPRGALRSYASDLIDALERAGLAGFPPSPR